MTTTNGSGLNRFFDSVRSSGVERSDQRWLAGVAGGVAQRLGIDPNIFRLIVFVLIFIGVGSVSPVYLAAWVILPDARTGRIILQDVLGGSRITA